MTLSCLHMNYCVVLVPGRYLKQVIHNQGYLYVRAWTYYKRGKEDIVMYK